MCCFFSTILFFGPRLGFLVYWLLPFGRLKIFTAFNTWIFPLLGLIFLPWTTLMYVIVFPVFGLDWLWIALAAMVDIAAYGGGAYNRRQVPGYPGS